MRTHRNHGPRNAGQRKHWPRLPQMWIDRLDADGRVRGLTWWDMPAESHTEKALEWWLWKRRMINLSETKAAARAAQSLAESP